MLIQKLRICKCKCCFCSVYPWNRWFGDRCIIGAHTPSSSRTGGTLRIIRMSKKRHFIIHSFLVSWFINIFTRVTHHRERDRDNRQWDKRGVLLLSRSRSQTIIPAKVHRMRCHFKDARGLRGWFRLMILSFRAK